MHRGALIADGFVRGPNLICGVRNWDYRLGNGVSAHANDEALPKFNAWIEGEDIGIDADETNAWGDADPQPYNRKAYPGLYLDPRQGIGAEHYNGLIQSYAKFGLKRTRHHGVVEPMGVPLNKHPDWDDIQLFTEQKAKAPMLEDDDVGTGVVILSHRQETGSSYNPPPRFRYEFQGVVKNSKSCPRSWCRISGYRHLFWRRRHATPTIAHSECRPKKNPSGQPPHRREICDATGYSLKIPMNLCTSRRAYVGMISYQSSMPKF